MTTEPVDLDALDARYKAAGSVRAVLLTYTPVARAEMQVVMDVYNAYPVIAEELRSLRKLVREYTEAREGYRESQFSKDNGADQVAMAVRKLTDAADAVYTAGKKIAKYSTQTPADFVQATQDGPNPAIRAKRVKSMKTTKLKKDK